MRMYSPEDNRLDCCMYFPLIYALCAEQDFNQLNKVYVACTLSTSLLSAVGQGQVERLTALCIYHSLIAQEAGNRAWQAVATQELDNVIGLLVFSLLLHSFPAIDYSNPYDTYTPIAAL